MEFELVNKITGENTFRYGANEQDMWNKTKLNPNEWEVVCKEYLDREE